jgi:hypothetical protein
MFTRPHERSFILEALSRRPGHFMNANLCRQYRKSNPPPFVPENAPQSVSSAFLAP